MVKNLPASTGDTSSIPGSRRSPEEGNVNPPQYSCLENPMDRGAWWVTRVRHNIVTKQRYYILAIIMFFYNYVIVTILEEAMAPHSSILAWKIPWTEEPGRLQSMGTLRVRPTEWLHFHFSPSCSGEGNGNPLQCSCLENPREGGAWRAAVYGVAQSWTWLKWLSSSSSHNIYCSGSFHLVSFHTCRVPVHSTFVVCPSKVNTNNLNHQDEPLMTGIKGTITLQLRKIVEMLL